MNFRQPAIYVIIATSLILAIGWVYYGNKKKSTSEKTETTASTEQKTDQKSISNLTNINPTEFDSLTKKTYAEANQKALEANDKNKIAAVDIKVDENLSPDTVITRYVFNASNDLENNWVMTFSDTGNQYVRALIPVQDYAGTLTPMNTSAWKYNFVTALQLAEKNGGLDWREGKELSGVKLMLKHTGKKNWLLWVVEYQSNNENFKILLDANSGRVVVE